MQVTVSSFGEFVQKARNVVAYKSLRKTYPWAPAASILKYIKDDDGGMNTQSFEQYLCRHDWVENEESGRCYCLSCGLDGDM